MTGSQDYLTLSRSARQAGAEVETKTGTGSSWKPFGSSTLTGSSEPVVSPLVTVKLLVVMFEHFVGCAKVVVMLTNSGGCNLKSRQILRTSRGNPQVERATKLPCQDPC